MLNSTSVRNGLNPCLIRPLRLLVWLLVLVNLQVRAADVSVDATRVVRTVDERVFGLNTAVWDNAFKDPATLQLLRAINIRTLRFPGGSTSDTYDWQTNKSYQTGTRILNTWAWSTSFDDFAATAVKLNANVFITVNYGSGTAQQAADWVTYSNVTRKYGFRYWELGNENYGNWEEDVHPVKWDPVTYATEAKDYITKMKAVDAGIKVGVVVVDGEDSYADNTRPAAKNLRTGVLHRGWTPVMLSTLKALGVTPDFAVFHRYPYGPFNESDANLLTGRSQGGTTWGDDAAGLRAQLNDYLGAEEGSRVELVVTENNSVYSNPGKQTTSLVNGLFLADSLGQVLQTEFNGFVWWDLRNSQHKENNNSAALYGWRNYGDYGVIASGNATETPVNEPYPTYHIMKLLQHFARGGDQVVHAISNHPLLAVYAAKLTNGTLSLLFINKSSTETTTANVAINGFVPAARAPVYRYGIPQDDAARTRTGFTDISLSSLGKVGPTFSASFAPYSVSVLQLHPVDSPRSRIVNLSVRAIAGGGSQTLIVGFVVGGGTGRLPIVVRALGPKLLDLGVIGAVANPQLELHTRSSGVDVVAATNDNWASDPGAAAIFQRLGALPLVNNSLDATLFHDVERQPYTAHVGVSTGHGVALAEVYDASEQVSASTPRLVNIAGRAQVNTGEGVLVAGFVVSGHGPKTVLIRGVGPLLATLGVAGALAAPKLELHQRIQDQDTVIASNTGWGGAADLSSVFAQVGATPWDNPASKDAALLVTLQPGVYSAVVSGVGDSTGVALVEVYEVD